MLVAHPGWTCCSCVGKLGVLMSGPMGPMVAALAGLQAALAELLPLVTGAAEKEVG